MGLTRGVTFPETQAKTTNLPMIEVIVKEITTIPTENGDALTTFCIFYHKADCTYYALNCDELLLGNKLFTRGNTLTVTLGMAEDFGFEYDGADDDYAIAISIDGDRYVAPRLLCHSED